MVWYDDEVSLEIGDVVYVNKKDEDLWFVGINLWIGELGIFLFCYVFDILWESDV